MQSKGLVTLWVVAHQGELPFLQSLVVIDTLVVGI